MTVLLPPLDAFYFFFLSVVTRTSNTMLNRSGESGLPGHVPDLSGKAFSFCLLSMMLAVGLSYMAFIMSVSYTHLTLPTIHVLCSFVSTGILSP